MADPKDAWITEGVLGPPVEQARAKEWVKWLRSIVSSIICYTILGSIYAAVQWYQSGLTLAERGREVRADNELRALLWLDTPRKHTQYVQPGAPVVRPTDLARAYHDSRRGADFAYTGQTIAVPVRDYVVRGREIHWHLGDPRTPALVVMVLAEGAGVPAMTTNHTRILWVTGECRGRVDDGVSRDQADYTFHVRIVNCRAVLE